MTSATDRYADVPLGVECAWPAPQLPSQLLDVRSQPFPLSSSLEGSDDVGALSFDPGPVAP